MTNILEQHDIVLKAYRRKREQAQEFLEKNEPENAKLTEFYADGIDKCNRLL